MGAYAIMSIRPILPLLVGSAGQRDMLRLRRPNSVKQVVGCLAITRYMDTGSRFAE